MGKSRLGEAAVPKNSPALAAAARSVVSAAAAGPMDWIATALPTSNNTAVGKAMLVTFVRCLRLLFTGPSSSLTSCDRYSYMYAKGQYRYRLAALSTTSGIVPETFRK